MRLAPIIKRVQNIFSEPVKEFIKISKEPKKPLSLFFEFTLPFLILYTLASYLGKIVFSPATFNVGTGIVLKSILLMILVIIIGIYTVSLVVNELLPVFHSQKDISKSYSLVTYSLTPVFVAISLSGLIPKLSMLFNLIGLYSIILYWIGTAAIIDMTKERRQIFVPLSLLCILLIFLIIRIILGALFSL